MNLLDLAFILILVLFGLYGIYRGFFYTVTSIGAYVISCILALILMGVVSNIFKNNDKLYQMMLYYTEGSEYIEDVELSKTPITEISSEDIKRVVSNDQLPHPMGKSISQNIAKESFADEGAVTLGDYFNLTIVNVFINILSFLIVFVITRLILTFVINGYQYVREFPMLRQADRLIGAGFGLLRGLLFLFPLMMLTPIILTVLPFDFINELILHSFFAPFFYQSNFLLGLMPGV